MEERKVNIVQRHTGYLLEDIPFNSENTENTGNMYNNYYVILE